MEKEFLEQCLTEGMSLEAIGKRVGKHESTVSYWLKKHRLEAAGSETHAPNAKVDPQRLEELVEQGASIQKMGDEFGAGRSTIRYWLRKLGLETERSTRLRETRAACKEGVKGPTSGVRSMVTPPSMRALKAGFGAGAAALKPSLSGVGR